MVSLKHSNIAGDNWSYYSTGCNTNPHQLYKTVYIQERGIGGSEESLSENSIFLSGGSSRCGRRWWYDEGETVTGPERSRLVVTPCGQHPPRPCLLLLEAARRQRQVKFKLQKEKRKSKKGKKLTENAWSQEKFRQMNMKQGKKLKESKEPFKIWYFYTQGLIKLIVCNIFDLWKCNYRHC